MLEGTSRTDQVVGILPVREHACGSPRLHEIRRLGAGVVPEPVCVGGGRDAEERRAREPPKPSGRTGHCPPSSSRRTRREGSTVAATARGAAAVTLLGGQILILAGCKNQALTPCYWARSATTASTRVARRSGISNATAAQTTRTMTEVPIVIGSNGDTA